MKKIPHNRTILYLIPIIFLPLSLLQADQNAKAFQQFFTISKKTVGQGVGIAQIGDPQCDLDGQGASKKGHIELIKKLAAGKSIPAGFANRTYTTAFPGDLIDGQSGLDSYGFWFWFLQYIPGLRKGIKQTDVLKKKYLNSLDEAKICVLLCAGNHDFGDATRSALKLIKKRHGKLYYTHKVGNVTFLNCGVYPDKKTVLPWLKKELAKAQGKPVAIAFHFNILGKHNNWWTIEERQAFLDAIKNKNVQLIMHGHDHSAYTGSIDGIPVVCSGGDKLPVSLFDANGRYEKTVFLKAQQESNGEYTPVPVSVRTVPVLNTPSTKEEDAFRKKSLQLINNDF